MAILIEPSVLYEDIYREALEEVKKESGQSSSQFEILEEGETFPDFIERLYNYRNGLGLPAGYIPMSVFWLVDGDEFVGRVSIRHSLTPHLRAVGGHIGYEIRPSKRRSGYGKQILSSALIKANELGLNDVLITCDADNIASRKIIVHNGGVLESQAEQEKGMPAKLRFWIKLRSK